MNSQEFEFLLIKTIFCCMTVDGEIEEREISKLKELLTAVGKHLSTIADIEENINKLINDINKEGKKFILDHILFLTANENKLSEDEKFTIINHLLSMIKADEEINYQEILYFKEVVKALKISKEKILGRFPDIELSLVEQDIASLFPRSPLGIPISISDLPKFELVSLRKDLM
ncbi:MAG: TerB family tellurite resistance protein [Candidatus Hydrogenedentes bacterium]|nr:TerB family tellurite resistance protein [Candidatus Hydrogenedentota bacterium]